MPEEEFFLSAAYRTELPGEIRTFLWVAEGSSPDHAAGRKGVGRVDSLMAIPTLCWIADEHDLARTAVELQVKLLDASPLENGSIPFAVNSNPNLKFSLSNLDENCVLSIDGPAGIFSSTPFPIVPRLGWFLKLSKTLVLAIICGEDVWIASVVAESGMAPQLASMAGSLGNKSLEKIVQHSTSWTAGLLGNPSISAGNSDVADDHFDVYSSDQFGRLLPNRLRQEDTCLVCGGRVDSVEHCTPNWMATDQGVTPVTAKIFCEQCNNDFGFSLEKPMAEIYRSGKLTQEVNSRTFALWSVKTALTLAAASGVRFDPGWLASLHQGDIPEGFEVFANTSIQTEMKGYRYATTIFSESRRKAGYFLCSLVIPEAIILVSRGNRLSNYSCPLDREYPSFKRGFTVSRISHEELHMEFLSAMTGERFMFTPRDDSTPHGR